MSTSVRNWHIVSIFNRNQLVGRVLWGICTHDLTCRFTVGDYICTSNIVEIRPKEYTVTTYSGNIYLVEGDGKKSEIQIQEFELLRRGISPDEIYFLKKTANKYN